MSVIYELLLLCGNMRNRMELLRRSRSGAELGISHTLEVKCIVYLGREIFKASLKVRHIPP